MPNLDNLNLPDAFSIPLKPDEQLKHWAYGIRQSKSLLLLIALLAGAVTHTVVFVIKGIPNPHNPIEYGIIGIIMAVLILPFIPMVQKEYLLGLTDKRLIIIRIKKSIFTSSVQYARQLDFNEYALQNLRPININPGGLSTTIKIDDPAKPFSVKFPNAKGNREQVEAITDLLNER
jgi:hypothetical protein